MTRSFFAAFSLVLILGVQLALGLSSEDTQNLETRIVGGAIAESKRYPYYMDIRVGRLLVQDTTIPIIVTWF